MTSFAIESSLLFMSLLPIRHLAHLVSTRSKQCQSAIWHVLCQNYNIPVLALMTVTTNILCRGVIASTASLNVVRAVIPSILNSDRAQDFQTITAVFACSNTGIACLNPARGTDTA